MPTAWWSWRSATTASASNRLSRGRATWAYSPCGSAPPSTGERLRSRALLGLVLPSAPGCRFPAEAGALWLGFGWLPGASLGAAGALLVGRADSLGLGSSSFL